MRICRATTKMCSSQTPIPQERRRGEIPPPTPHALILLAVFWNGFERFRTGRSRCRCGATEKSRPGSGRFRPRGLCPLPTSTAVSSQNRTSSCRYGTVGTRAAAVFARVHVCVCCQRFDIFVVQRCLMLMLFCSSLPCAVCRLMWPAASVRV